MIDSGDSMKAYGESIFDILYLIFAVAVGVVILRKARDRRQRLMGIACITLGLGDAFHLVPRVLSYFVTADFNTALGVGKLITSITMTVFYILMYHILIQSEGAEEKRPLTVILYALAALRIGLCLMPQNDWIHNSSPLLWGVLRNIPFLFIGAIIAVLYYRARKVPYFRFIWLFVVLSFAFYIPVVVGAEAVPILGMLMLPRRSAIS